MSSVAWRAIWIEATDGSWIQRAKKSKFIGYDEESKAYLLMDLETRRVVRARSVTFNEKVIPDDFMADSEPLKNLELSIEGCIDIEQPSTTKTSEARSAPTEGDTADSVGTTEENQVEEEAVDSHSTDYLVQRSVRIRNPPIRYGLAYTHSIRTCLYPCFSDWNLRAKGLFRSSAWTRKGALAGINAFRGEVSRSHGNMDTC